MESCFVDRAMGQDSVIERGSAVTEALCVIRVFYNRADAE